MRRRFVTCVFAIVFACACESASAAGLDNHALGVRALNEVSAHDYVAACRDFTELSSRTGGFLKLVPHGSSATPTPDYANSSATTARGLAHYGKYAMACSLAYVGALSWRARGDDASTMLLTQEAAGYAKAAGIAAPDASVQQAAHTPARANHVAGVPAFAASAPGKTVTAALLSQLGSGKAIVSGDGVSNWAAYEQGYGCTYTAFTGPAGGMSGPYQMSPYGIRQSILQTVWLTSPSTYRVAGGYPGTGAFTFDRRFPGPLQPSFHGILVFTSGPLRGHTAIIADTSHKTKILYFPLDWVATNGKSDTFDPHSGTNCESKATP